MTEQIETETEHYTIEWLRGAPNGRLALFIHKDCPCTRTYCDGHEEGELLFFYYPDENAAECNSCDWKGSLTEQHWVWIRTWYEDWEE